MIIKTSCREILLARTENINFLPSILGTVPPGSSIIFFVTGDRRRVKTKEGLRIDQLQAQIREKTANGETWINAFRSSIACESLPCRITKVLVVAQLPAK